MMGKHGATWESPEKEPPHKKQDSGPSPSPKKLRITIRKPPSALFSSSSSSNAVTSGDDVGGDSSDNNNSNSDDNDKKRPPSVTIHDLFDIQKLIGEGGFGKVYLAIRRRDQASVALKAIPVSLPDSEETLKREVEALSALSDPGHPNVCQLYDQLRDNLHSYLSMEYIGGGELFEHLCDSGPFSEKDAAKFLRQFANGLHYIHSKGYVHSDLKPENLMMGYSWGQQVEDDNDNDNNAPAQQQQQQQQLKVVDFGFSVPDQESVKLHFHGTIAYLPPECLHKKSSPRHPTAAGDMFAVGVIIYTVLTGTHPFDRTNQAPDSIIAQAIVQSAGSTYDDNDDDNDSNNNNNNNNNNNSKSNDNDKDNNEYLSKYVFDDRTQGLSSSSVMLMRSLLHPDPNRRMTSLQLCSHPWILGQTATKHSLSTCSHSKLKSFWQRRFRAAVMKKFVGRSNNGGGTLSTKEYKVIFKSMDLDGNGLVTLDELKRYMSESFGTKQTISDIFSSVDEDGNGGIDFEEFDRIMRKKFDGSDVSNCNSCNDDIIDDNNDNNSKKAASEKILAISNEQVRACIFQKFGGTRTKGTTTTTTTTSTTTVTREMLRTIFDTMDINKDGSLQLSEAITGLRETPGLDEGMISSWVRRLYYNPLTIYVSRCASFVVFLLLSSLTMKYCLFMMHV
jgi:serine/threonine protein kinase